MSRYNNTTLSTSKSTKLRKKTQQKYDTTLYSKVPVKDSDIFIITQEGDRLDLLANQFYSDPSLWWFIANVNNISTNNVPQGTSLRIPVTTEFASGK
jgi:hypothetical protein